MWGNARAGNALAYETRVGSPLDFQLKRVSAPSCLRALRSMRSSRSSRPRLERLTLRNPPNVGELSSVWSAAQNKNRTCVN